MLKANSGIASKASWQMARMPTAKPEVHKISQEKTFEYIRYQAIAVQTI